VACRQFQPPQAISPESVRPYDGHEIMLRERELLGVWITHSPFEMIGEDALGAVDQNGYQLSFTAQEIEALPAGSDRAGFGLIEEVKTRRDRNGNEYAFVKINMQDGIIEAICFASVWNDPDVPTITKDRICVVTISKNPRGYQLTGFEPIDLRSH
jgi:DNA polymerase III alpha subunit